MTIRYGALCVSALLRLITTTVNLEMTKRVPTSNCYEEIAYLTETQDKVQKSESTGKKDFVKWDMKC